MKIRYAINMNDFRIVPATDEVLANPNYRQVTENTAEKIGSGELEGKTVVAQILARSTPQDYDTIKRQRLALNVKPATVRKEDAEEEDVKPIDADTADGFDAQIPDKPSLDAVPEVPQKTETDPNKMGLDELRDYAQGIGINGVLLMKRNELLSLIAKRK